MPTITTWRNYNIFKEKVNSFPQFPSNSQQNSAFLVYFLCKPKYKKEDIPTIDFEEEKIGNKKQNNAAVTSSVVSSIVNNSK